MRQIKRTHTHAYISPITFIVGRDLLIVTSNQTAQEPHLFEFILLNLCACDVQIKTSKLSEFDPVS